MRKGDRVKVNVQHGATYVTYVGNLQQNLSEVVLTDVVCGEDTYKEIAINQRYVISITVLEA